MDYAGPTVGVTDRRTGKVHEPKVVRQGAGGVKPHIRRCDPEPVAVGLDRVRNPMDACRKACCPLGVQRLYLPASMQPQGGLNDDDTEGTLRCKKPR